MIVRLACVVLTCDGCTDGWDEETPHFESRAEAVKVARSCRWRFVAGRALCPDCAAAADCTATGHRWGDWADWHTVQMSGTPYRCRFCDRCGERETDPPRHELWVLLAAAQAVQEAAESIARSDPEG